VTTLLYLGAHQGGGLARLVNSFDRVIAFEANPAHCAVLASRFPSVELVGAAVCVDDGEVPFHISSNDGGSSSLGEFDEAWLAPRTDALRMTRTITVPGVNLHRFCLAHGVETIDSYVSDLQGMDLAVLTTMLPLLRDGKLKLIQCETTKDGRRNIYKNLPSNELRDFSRLLTPFGYSLVATGWGELQMGVFSEVPDDWWEFDALWEHGHGESG
jgi:FkbM family methyltransferase